MANRTATPPDSYLRMLLPEDRGMDPRGWAHIFAINFTPRAGATNYSPDPRSPRPCLHSQHHEDLE